MSTPTALPLLALVAGTVTKAYRARVDRARTDRVTGPAPSALSGPPERDVTPGTVSARLHDLQDHYTYAVNSALEEGRDDLAEQLAERYDAEALAVVGGGPGPRDLRR